MPRPPESKASGALSFFATGEEVRTELSVAVKGSDGT